jgi:hypothetical protein
MNGIAIDHSQLKQYLVVLGDVRARRKDFNFFEKSGKPYFRLPIIGAPHYIRSICANCNATGGSAPYCSGMGAGMPRHKYYTRGDRRRSNAEYHNYLQIFPVF